MKLIIGLLLLTSMNIYAKERAGYACIATISRDAVELHKLKNYLGPNYLSEIGVLLVSPKDCSATVPGVGDVCKLGSLTLTIGVETKSRLLSGRKTIRLNCDELLDAHGRPSLGGSN